MGLDSRQFQDLNHTRGKRAAVIKDLREMGID